MYIEWKLKILAHQIRISVIFTHVRLECEGWIEKTCPEDHPLALRGLPTDDKW